MIRPLILKAVGLCISVFLAIPLALYALYSRKKLSDAFSHKVRKDRPPVLDSYGKHRYLDLPKGKIRIHVVDNGRSEDDRRPLMLFVHGFPDFWYSYRHQMKYFSSKFRCVSMDNRGYNESDKPQNITDYSITNLASDVKEVVEILGYEKCILVAHDWGGNIGYRVASIYPEIVSLFIVCNMPHYLALKDSFEASWSQKLASWYFFFFQAPVLPEVLINSLDMNNWDKMFKDIPYDSEEDKKIDTDAYKYVFSQPNALTGPINYYRCSNQYPIELKKIIVKVPVCSIFGSADKYLLRESFLGSAKYVEDFTLKELPGISHWSHVHAKDEVNRLMDEYINQKADKIA